MKASLKTKGVIAIIMVCSLLSCEDFLEIEAPDHKMISKVVFTNDETAISAMAGIYNQLFRASFSNGGSASVTVLSGLSGDNISPIRTTNLPFLEFERHEILPGNFRNFKLWSSAYNIIYMTNSLIEGVENSETITEEVRHQLVAEARVVRAFTYFYLVNLYGDVPLILTTDYRKNSIAKRDRVEEVYSQILEDLETALRYLDESYPNGERTRINRYTATALLARVHLYLQDWEQAEKFSGEVINQDGTYELLEDLDLIFLANSKEAIWQLSPKGRGSISTHTNEGSVFIIHPFLSFLSHLKLIDGFPDIFEQDDKRRTSWIGFHSRMQSYFPFKYKINNSTDEISEYSMVLRLAEQYLIRAEARAMQGNLAGAIADLDKIRGRAGLELLSDTNPGISKEKLLNSILEERRRELFSEWGHRWLDLKRTGRADEVFGNNNPLWQDSDVLYPIPEDERMKNPNLTQNTGY